jgi:hypothetical protein
MLDGPRGELEKGLFAMTKSRTSDVDFCIDDNQADLVAGLLVGRIRQAASEMESAVNRLYRGRNACGLGPGAQRDLAKTIRRLEDIIDTLRDVERAQAGVVYLQAAE